MRRTNPRHKRTGRTTRAVKRLHRHYREGGGTNSMKAWAKANSRHQVVETWLQHKGMI